MAKMFMYRGKVFSVSDRNQFGEFVVVKFSSDLKKVEGAKVIPANNEMMVEKLVRTYNFENFKNLPDDPTRPESDNPFGGIIQDPNSNNKFKLN